VRRVRYPGVLRQLTNAELAELLARFERVPPAPDDCGAREWSGFDQRTHEIVHPFRAIPRTGDLHDPPFTEDQVACFSRGVVPRGEL
jgi:hypothetical protein